MNKSKRKKINVAICIFSVTFYFKQKIFKACRGLLNIVRGKKIASRYLRLK